MRYFDTSPHYGLGLSELRLGGSALSAARGVCCVDQGRRLLVASPATADRVDADGFVSPATHRRVWDFSRDGIHRSIEASLHRTGLDRIDIVYRHDPDRHWQQAADEGIPALVELRDQGIVGAIGAGMNQT